MTEEQKNILDERFSTWEKYSTWLVLVLFTIITVLAIIDPHDTFIQDYIKLTFRICLGLVFSFVIFSLVKDLFYPVIAKFYFKD
jgi:prepilin signal peptidase PulO-like enzyme (type II secretory pathway)